MPKTHPRSTPTVEIHGFALRMIREARGRKVQDLADALDVTRSYIAKIELGHSRRVSEVFYARLLSELRIDDDRALLAEAPKRTAKAVA